MNLKRIIRFVVVSLLSVLVFFSIVTVCSISIILFDRKTDQVEKSVKYYQYLRQNRLTNETYRGITSQTEISDPRGFLSFSDNFGSYVLISEFGSSEYECTGKCSCNGISRRSSVTISRSLAYLVATISSSLAINHAKEYFENQCKTELSDSCEEEGRILSEVDSCEEIVYPHIEEESKRYDRDTEEIHFSYEDEGTRIFWCKGRCTPATPDEEFGVSPLSSSLSVMDILDEFDISLEVMEPCGAVEEKLVREFGCEKLTLENENWTNMNKYEERFSKKLWGSEEEQIKNARFEFGEDHLLPHCLRNSIKKGAWVRCMKDEESSDTSCYENSLDEFVQSIDDYSMYKKMKEKCIDNCEFGEWIKKPMCVPDYKSVVCTKMEEKTELFLEQVSRRGESQQSHN